MIGRSGASFGKVHYCSEDYWPLNTALFATDFAGNEPRFVYYALKSIAFTAFNSGSAQASLNRNFIANIPVAIPPREEQRRIAHVLGALDDRIHSNTRVADHSARLARTEFRRLFGGRIEGTEPLGDHVSVVRGRSYKSSELVPSDRALITLKSVRPGGGYQPGGLKAYTETSRQSRS